MAMDLTAVEAAELQTFLAQNYNTPSDQWLDGLVKQFDTLKTLLEQGVEPTQKEPESGISEQLGTPAAARAAALPVVRLDSRNFLIGTDECMPCYGIGTISPGTFADIFWQRVNEVNNENQSAQIEIYLAQDNNFEFRFGRYMFQLMYLQNEEVARRLYHFRSLSSNPLIINRYTDIVKTAPESLKERARTDTVYGEIGPSLVLRHLASSPSRALGIESTRRAFYILRAHAIERGILYNLPLLPHAKVFFHAQYILILLNRAVASLLEKSVSITLQSVIAECYRDIPDLHSSQACLAQCPVGRDFDAERMAPTLMPLSQSVLMRVRALNMDMKMNFPYFVKVDVEHNGSSSIQRGVFLAMVERELHQLRKNISETLKKPEATEKPPCVLWPNRLVETPKELSGVNRWIYVLGLTPIARGDPVFEAKLHVKVEEWSCSVTSQKAL
ncbi:hypothetical protein ONS95_009300 [Cadophora gregata]|uniref:uncharacterized protein n=1 Tax=Cadophora gregata TaxID=51156 RepID=UPI0026DD7AC2|nr:uncharacterized protein ONS95_009300 [Cadophora gregata]KAK0124330.1 hypothetical protein ONS95_009300 [Cadophora gregata]KAK0129817.1 hypothetical protein ONS96_000366 [Cadophora gregata f. sp. sojae]